MQLSHQQVMEILPHRDPLLLIDEVRELTPGERVEATFYVDPGRDIFRGHFPEEAVFPGVYTVEAAAQAADILLLSLDRYKGKIPLFLGIQDARFLRKILPGDTLEIHAVLTGERREKGIATCSATVFANHHLAAETVVTLAMRQGAQV
ncbi:MAG: 3-hydroxyacyl-ACP dehydratase FabZ [Planctomycetota bacterium]|jgi:3-hydroxyacyl-[acyl-carrier-protein] dehydratase|nr:3-hydroxyacyl-ACP dehydratase FabZ [Planctomycetota bacterium]